MAESEKLHLFFTGNVKIDGDYDYINEGRETSTLHVESEDGIHFGDKEEIISFEKYPEEFTCHIRDPKVWKENDRYFMVLGGRPHRKLLAICGNARTISNWTGRNFCLYHHRA